MINGCEIHVDFSGDTRKSLTLASEELEKLGYALKHLKPDELKMSFDGKRITSDPEAMKHSVTVKPDGGSLSFKFGTGLIASHWTDSDKEWAQARAGQVVDGIRARIGE